MNFSFKKKPSVKLVFTGMVMFMWASSFIADLANPKYDPPAYVNPLIMMVGGYMFATSGSSDKSKEKDGGNSEETPKDP